MGSGIPSAGFTPKEGPMSESLRPDQPDRPVPPHDTGGDRPAPARPPDGDAAGPEQPDIPRPRLTAGGRRRRRALRPADEPRGALTPEQRLLVLDAWARSGLP